MPSPFPGMNPYLEREGLWHEVHQRLATVVSDLLIPQARPKYIVRMEINVYLHELSGEERRAAGRPDVFIARPVLSPQTGSAALQAPAYGAVHMAVDEERVSYIEIRDRDKFEVISVIELLSPSNKVRGADRELYLGKRWRYLMSTANFVEIDLLRGGERMPIDGLPPCDYCVMVSRTAERPRVGIWPIGLRDRLPVVPIPLRGDDPDLKLDLQEALHRVYDAARYEDYIYSNEPEPPLSIEGSTWAKSLIELR